MITKQLTKQPTKQLTKLEKELQGEFIKALRGKGMFVWKLQENATTPAGEPDTIICYKGFYGFLEFKREATSEFQPLQKLKLRKYQTWRPEICMAWVVHKDNKDEVMEKIVKRMIKEDILDMDEETRPAPFSLREIIKRRKEEERKKRSKTK